MEQARKTTTLFIDVDNVRVKAIPLILGILTPEWLPIKIGAYGPQMRQKQRLFRDNRVIPGEIAPVQPARDSADLILTIDAMEELYCGIAIASGDSDFTPLALKIRERGKPILLFGHSFTPFALRKAATNSITLDGSNKNRTEKRIRLRLQSLMADLINEIGSDQKQVTLCGLSGTIGQRDPIFTPKRYGCKFLKALLAKLGFTLIALRKQSPTLEGVVATSSLEPCDC